MKKSQNVWTLLLVVAMAGLALSAAGCQKLEARDQLNRGVAAFNAAQFNAAITNFQQAIKLDPTLVNAKLYLATAYQSQFVPGSPTPDNMRYADNALSEYKNVLEQDPANANAVAGIARLNYDMGDLEEARHYYERSLQLSPKDPTAYYTIGAIDYQETHPAILLLRQSEGITDASLPLVNKRSSRKDKQQCQALNEQDTSKLDDGVQQLKKALELRPGYADAMTYLNLLYREKADLACGNKLEREANVTIANNYVNEALATRKAQVAAENKKNSGGVVEGAAKPKGGSGNE
ncbi:MAG: tetratricopeptide repeat protein [Terriglobales bacterium]